MEKLITYNPKEVLEKGKAILRDNGALPPDCPSQTCLNLRSIALRINNMHGYKDKIIFSAYPPELPTTDPLLKYELNPICERVCGIHGNSNRHFIIEQDSKSGNIISAEAEWNDHY